jgi:hypothetical protein
MFFIYIHTLHEGYLNPGSYSITWNGKTSANTLVESGVYLYELRTGNFREIRKLVYMK